MTPKPVRPFVDGKALRTELIGAYRRLAELGYIVGTWGNASVRLEEGVLITPSRVPIGEMTPRDLVVVSWEGEKIRGERLPSSEMHVHRLLLLARPDIGSFIHTHSTYASIVSAVGMSIPVLLEEMSQIVGGPVGCTEYVRGGEHLELARNAAGAIGRISAAVLLGHHGPVVGGRDVGEALAAAQILEKAARTALYARLLGAVEAIPDGLVEEERRRFLYRYGSDADFAGEKE